MEGFSIKNNLTLFENLPLQKWQEVGRRPHLVTARLDTPAVVQ